MDDFGRELKRWMDTRSVSVRGFARDTGYSHGQISDWRSGRRQPSPEQARDLDDALDAGGQLFSAAPAAPVDTAGAASTDALFASGLGNPRVNEQLTMAVTGEPVRQEEPPSISELADMAQAIRRLYQECQYSAVAAVLPATLASLSTATEVLDGDNRSAAQLMLADVYHVAAGLLLKLEDPALAAVAADRSMRTAIASQDPVAVGSSARILTHTLMDTGHPGAAVTTAATHAETLGRTDTTPDGIAVYGALLLRGAVAAAQQEQRDTALTMLTEAGQAGTRLGRDGNLRWTAFGPVNTAIHRVSIAVTLGDAGSAIDAARRVNLSAITVTERKACLLTHVAQAYMQWGKHERALAALHAAAEAALEEVTGRPGVRRLLRDLATTAPMTVRSDARQFARRLGVTLR
jgi:transcriptional regulator with XRE-family HTH domain